MYNEAQKNVTTIGGDMNAFLVAVGLHQGSLLSPYQFILGHV